MVNCPSRNGERQWLSSVDRLAFFYIGNLPRLKSGASQATPGATTHVTTRPPRPGGVCKAKAKIFRAAFTSRSRTKPRISTAWKPCARFVEAVLVPSARILILTMHDDPQYLRQTLKHGASGCILKKAADAKLLFAMRSVLRGEVYILCWLHGTTTMFSKSLLRG